MRNPHGSLVRVTILALAAFVSSRISAANRWHTPRIYACSTCEWDSCGDGGCGQSSCAAGGNYSGCSTDGAGSCNVYGEGCC
jgi:hypothetical protein